MICLKAQHKKPHVPESGVGLLVCSVLDQGEGIVALQLLISLRKVKSTNRAMPTTVPLSRSTRLAVAAMVPLVDEMNSTLCSKDGVLCLSSTFTFT